MHNFISPKNFKSGRLISNKYTVKDLIILICGIILSFVLEILFITYFLAEDNTTLNLIIAVFLVLPAGLALLLVMPSGIYHNVLTFLELLIIDIRSPKSYIWGGLKRNVIKEK